MTVLAEVLAVLKADNSGFKSTIVESNEVLREFGLELGVTEGKMNTFSASSVAAGAAISAAFITSIKGAIDTTIDYTNTIEGLEVSFNAMTGSSNEMLVDVEKFAVKMGLSIDAVANMSRQLEISSSGLHNTEKDWKNFADIAAGTRKEIDYVAQAFSYAFQILQKEGGGGAGRVGQMLLRQHLLGEGGPDILNEVTKMVKNGADIEAIWQKLTSSAETFSGAGEAASHTLKGITQSAKDLMAIGVGELFTPLIAGIEKIAEAIAKEDWSGFISFWESMITVMQNVVVPLAGIAEGIIKIVAAVSDVASAVPGLAALVVALGAFLAIWGTIQTVTTGKNILTAMSTAMNNLSGATAATTAELELSALSAEDLEIVQVALRQGINATTIALENLKTEMGQLIVQQEAGLITDAEMIPLIAEKAAQINALSINYDRLKASAGQAAAAELEAAEAANARISLFTRLGNTVKSVGMSAVSGFVGGSLASGLAGTLTEDKNPVATVGAGVLGGAALGLATGGPWGAAAGAAAGLASGLMNLHSSSKHAEDGIKSLTDQHLKGADAARAQELAIRGLSQATMASAFNAGEAARVGVGTLEGILGASGAGGELFKAPKSGSAASAQKADDSIQRAMEGQAKAAAELQQALELASIAFSGQNSMMTEALFLVHQLTPEQRSLGEAYLSQIRAIEPLANQLKSLQREYQRLSDEITRVQNQLDRPLAGEGEYQRRVRDLQSHIRALQNEAATASISGADPNHIAVLRRNIEELQLALDKLNNERTDLTDPVKAAIEAANAKPEISFDDAIAAAGQLKEFSSAAYEVKTQIDNINPQFNEMNNKLGDIASALGKVVSANQAVKSAAEQMASAQASAAASAAKSTGQASESITEYLTRTKKNVEQWAIDVEAAQEKGLDPNVLQLILKAGWEKNGALLHAIVTDSSGAYNVLLAQLAETLKKTGDIADRVGVDTDLRIHDREVKRQERTVKENAETLKKLRDLYVAVPKELSDQLGKGLDDVLSAAGNMGDLAGNKIIDAMISKIDGGSLKLHTAIKKLFGNDPLGILRIITGSADGNILSSANGNIFQSYASGGENHVAQIANASNNVRVWAEPETGGEAYIPLALSKRDRSMDILEDVAGAFGMQLTKIGSSSTMQNISNLSSSSTTHNISNLLTSHESTTTNIANHTNNLNLEELAKLMNVPKPATAMTTQIDHSSELLSGLARILNTFSSDLITKSAANISTGNGYAPTRPSVSESSGDINVEVNVAGHVLTERELGDMIRNEIYLYQRNNSGSSIRR